METHRIRFSRNICMRSYRTYEEWKRCLSLCTIFRGHLFLPYLWGMETMEEATEFTFEDYRSYRTYEEWKPISHSSSFFFNVCSYRTYEEWKPMNSRPVNAGDTNVLTVPMRNGNHQRVNYGITLLLLVLTVPMRNGNFFTSSCICSAFFQFLPYLWGMETFFRSIKRIPSLSSYRTYEEWKRQLAKTELKANTWVLTVPMRNGNKFRSAFSTPKFGFLPYLWGMETLYM